MDEQQLQLKLKTLNGEIVLAERKLSDLSHELEQLQTTRDQAFKSHAADVKKQQDQLAAITNEAKITANLARGYSLSLDELQEAHKTFFEKKREDIQEAKNAVRSIHEEVERREAAVKDREDNVTNREAAVENREKVVRNGEEALVVREEKVKIDVEELAKRTSQLLVDEEKSKHSLAQEKELLDDIDRQIRQKRMELHGLTLTIEMKEKVAKNTGQEVEARLTAVESRELLAEGKEKGLNERDTELNKKEIWLDDRERTVGRAYRETIQRGGVVDGA